MIDKNQVLDLVKQNGPVIPRDIVKELGGDTMLVGAVLSQLVDSKIIKLSYAKVGSSPVYYVTGQEPKLELLYRFLHEKEKKAYDRLKQEKILKDSSQEPVIRVALRNIKDFAKALEVNLKERKEIFWKWHLLPNNEAENLIRKILSKEYGVSKPIEKEPKKEPQETEQEYQNQTLESTKKQSAESIEKVAEEKQSKLNLNSDIKEKIKDHELLSKITSNFENKGIEIISHKVLRKNSDIEMHIKLPSPAGKLNYFCKIKDKKKSNDKDLSSVFVQAQMEKLPVLYVTTGELTKKAKQMLETEFRIITVMYI